MDRDAAMMTELKSAVNGGPSAAASSPREDVRLPGLYDRPVLFAAAGRSISDTPVGEVVQLLLFEISGMTGRGWAWLRRGGADRSTQQETERLGGLLLPAR